MKRRIILGIAATLFVVTIITALQVHAYRITGSDGGSTLRGTRPSEDMLAMATAADILGTKNIWPYTPSIAVTTSPVQSIKVPINDAGTQKIDFTPEGGGPVTVNNFLSGSAVLEQARLAIMATGGEETTAALFDDGLTEGHLKLDIDFNFLGDCMLRSGTDEEIRVANDIKNIFRAQAQAYMEWMELLNPNDLESDRIKTLILTGEIFRHKAVRVTIVSALNELASEAGIEGFEVKFVSERYFALRSINEITEELLGISAAHLETRHLFVKVDASEVHALAFWIGPSLGTLAFTPNLSEQLHLNDPLFGDALARAVSTSAATSAPAPAPRAAEGADSASTSPAEKAGTVPTFSKPYIDALVAEEVIDARKLWDWAVKANPYMFIEQPEILMEYNINELSTAQRNIVRSYYEKVHRELRTARVRMRATDNPADPFLKITVKSGSFRGESAVKLSDELDPDRSLIRMIPLLNRTLAAAFLPEKLTATQIVVDWAPMIRLIQREHLRIFGEGRPLVLTEKSPEGVVDALKNLMLIDLPPVTGPEMIQHYNDTALQALRNV